MPKMLAAGSMGDHLQRLMRALAGAALVLACSTCSQLGPSCDNSDQGNPPDDFRGGTVVARHYMSSPWSGPLLWLPGGKRYNFKHGLGCTPFAIEIWESFSENGTSLSSIAPAAGNMSLVQSVDSCEIRVKNDTCSDFFVLLTAEAPDCGGSVADCSGVADGGPDTLSD